MKQAAANRLFTDAQLPQKQRPGSASDAIWKCRPLMLLLAVLCFAPQGSLCQDGPANATPPKPLRERLLEKALKGDADAQFELGKNYETGRIGLPKDLAQARRWYTEAADAGDPFAAASLGILFNFGKGVQQDYVQAYMWYEVAISELTGGDKDSVLELRNSLAKNLTHAQISEANELARKWKPVRR